MPVLGHSDAGSVLADTSSPAEAQRLDGAGGGSGVDAHGHTPGQRRAAISLAASARDRAELVEFLGVCGLLPRRVPLR